MVLMFEGCEEGKYIIYFDKCDFGCICCCMCFKRGVVFKIFCSSSESYSFVWGCIVYLSYVDIL